MSEFVSAVEFVVVAIIVLVALTGVMAIIVSVLPHDNPLRQLLAAVTKRLALMLGLTVVAGMFEWVPGLDVLLDLAAIVVPVWYWLQLPGELKGTFSRPAAPARSRAPSSPMLPVPLTPPVSPARDPSPAARS